MDEVTKRQLDVYASLIIQQERLIQLQQQFMETQNKALRLAIDPIVYVKSPSDASPKGFLLN